MWDASHFLKTLSTSSLLQHVIGPTHKHGHTLDFVISRQNDNLITDCFIDSLLSDHHVVTCRVHCPKPLPAKNLVSARKFSRIDAGAFEHDLLHRLGSNNCSNVEELVDLYQKSIKEILDLTLSFKHLCALIDVASRGIIMKSMMCVISVVNTSANGGSQDLMCVVNSMLLSVVMSMTW